MPPHGPLETLRTIRRYEHAGLITPVAAEKHAEAIAGTNFTIIPAQAWMIHSIWNLRHNINPYDAAYVAIAQRFGYRLITLDERLVRAAERLGVEVRIPA
ncbi:hypothetical protein GCM10011359_26620 [Nesterenkonia alkaliphila]|nr:hypothetical protein GCM10011359_26620 [Nesterenkonia alkaliphila]